MEQAVDKTWSNYLDWFDVMYKPLLSRPVRSHFTTIGNLIIFELNNDLNPLLKQLLTVVFEGMYENDPLS